jgi:hypothetical protein
MPPEVFEPTISTGERPETYALRRYDHWNRPSHPCPRKKYPDDRYTKLQSYNSELILDRYEYTSQNIRNNALHDLTLIKVIV